METVRTAEALREVLAGWRRQGLTVGFVPTMGALHEGHLSLVRQAGERADRVVASVFVNPTQFGPDEDLDRYPRTPEKDAELLASAGCDLLFLPGVEDIYPPGEVTWVTVGGPAEGLEGAHRPGHFRGVATVVTKLLNLVGPDLAVFGRKDAQQLAVIEQLVRDLLLPVEILAGPTVREADGLAMSSRNAYLGPEERVAARVLSRALEKARQAVSEGADADRVRKILQETLTAEPRARIDYAEVVDAVTFQPVEGPIEGPVVLPLAVHIGGTRLIDNLLIDKLRLDPSGSPESES